MGRYFGNKLGKRLSLKGHVYTTSKFSFYELHACMHAYIFKYFLFVRLFVYSREQNIASTFKKLKFSGGDGQNNRAD